MPVGNQNSELESAMDMPLDKLWPDMQVLVIGKISNAVVLAGAAYQDEAGYSRMTGLPREKTRLLDDKGKTDTQACPQAPYCHQIMLDANSSALQWAP